MEGEPRLIHKVREINRRLTALEQREKIKRELFEKEVASLFSQLQSIFELSGQTELTFEFPDEDESVILVNLKKEESRIKIDVGGKDLLVIYDPQDPSRYRHPHGERFDERMKALVSRPVSDVGDLKEYEEIALSFKAKMEKEIEESKKKRGKIVAST